MKCIIVVTDSNINIKLTTLLWWSVKKASVTDEETLLASVVKPLNLYELLKPRSTPARRVGFTMQ